MIDDIKVGEESTGQPMIQLRNSDGNTMIFRKLQVHQITPAFRLATKLVEVPLSRPAPDQIRVKNIYAGVNATDINYTAARYQVDGSKVPYDIGIEGLGVVDAVGAAVPNGSVKVGQPVFVMDTYLVDGTFSEYLYKSPKSLIPVPELSPKYLMINSLTGSIGLDIAGHISNGQKVLITAAAGGTGHMALQWAKHRGCYVIGTTSGEEKTKFLKDLGADLVINYKIESLDSVLKEKFPDGLDLIWETHGGETFKTLLKNLAFKGRIVVIGSTTTYQSEGFADVPIAKLNAKLLMKSQSIHGFRLSHYPVEYRVEYLPKIIEMIENGTLQAKVDQGEASPGGKFLGLDQTYRAEEWLHSGQNVGKVVVQLHEN